MISSPPARIAPSPSLDLAVERAELRVVLEQVRHRLRVAEVVRGDDLDVRLALELRPEEVAPDPAEAVDAHTNRHSLLFLLR